MILRSLALPMLRGEVQYHVTDRRTLLPVHTGDAFLQTDRALSPGDFQWRTEIYEYVTNPIAIDLHFRSAREELAIEQGIPWQDACGVWEPEKRTFRQRGEPAL